MGSGEDGRRASARRGRRPHQRTLLLVLCFPWAHRRCAVVGKERIHKFARTQIHARHLCAFLNHQQPDNYATRPRNDTRT